MEFGKRLNNQCPKRRDQNSIKIKCETMHVKSINKHGRKNYSIQRQHSNLMTI